MEDERVGDVIATRKLSIIDDPSRTIVVTLGKPLPFAEQYYPGQKDYYCPYQITGIGNKRVMQVGGVDAFQALELAFRMIGSDLAAYNRKLGGRLRWECDEQGGLGFPIPTEF